MGIECTTYLTLGIECIIGTAMGITMGIVCDYILLALWLRCGRLCSDYWPLESIYSTSRGLLGLMLAALQRCVSEAALPKRRLRFDISCSCNTSFALRVTKSCFGCVLLLLVIECSL